MADEATPLLLLHGFTQTSVSWRPVRESLGPDRRVDAIDLPGHGTAGGVHADLADAAAHVAAAIGADQPPVVVGYSMGGRVALRLALDHPELITGLVLLGATAGIDDPDERIARRRADEALADRIEREGVERFLEQWMAQPLFEGLVLADDDRATRLSNTAEGLASSLRLAGTGTMDPPWWDELGAIAVPTLVVWGERDRKFAALGERLAAAIGPNASTASVSDAGHAAHLEAPTAFAHVLDSPPSPADPG